MPFVCCSELNEWYRHIAVASSELLDEFDYLAESRSTPETYGLRVRTHPCCLQITALNKMRNSHEIQVSWAERLIETYQLPLNEDLKNKNLVETDNFLSKLGKPLIKTRIICGLMFLRLMSVSISVISV